MYVCETIIVVFIFRKTIRTEKPIGEKNGSPLLHYMMSNDRNIQIVIGTDLYYYSFADGVSFVLITSLVSFLELCSITVHTLKRVTSHACNSYIYTVYI